MAGTTIPASRRIATSLPLVLCWIAAVWPLILWLITQSDPEHAVRLAQITATVLARGALAVAGITTLLVLLFPPFPAWIRLAFARMKLSFASDRGPMLKALGELQHFESPAKHLEVGRLALTRSELPLAAQHLSRAVELDGTIAGAHYQLGQLLMRIGQVKTAVAAFHRAEQLDPGHAFGEALLGVGRAALLLGDDQAALVALEDHQKQHGGNCKSNYWLGKARAATGNRQGAIEAMATAAKAPTQRISAEDNWFRALARVWLWRGRRA